MSHELSPLVRYVTRGDTTVLNAYLALPLRAYVGGTCRRSCSALDPRARLRLHAEQRRAGRGSGVPRAGERAVGAGRRADRHALGGRAPGSAAAHRLRYGRHLDGRVADRRRTAAAFRAHYRRRAPARSRCSTCTPSPPAAARSSPSATDASRWARPRPAADPGPACYGRGGPLTLTDVQVLLGQLRTDTLPALFGPDGARRIERAVVAQKFAALAAQVSPQVAHGVLGRERGGVVSRSRRRVDGERHPPGLDPPGARCGATSRCSASAARPASTPAAWRAPPAMRRILVHPLASVLSAFGIGVADRLAVRRASLRAPAHGAGSRQRAARSSGSRRRRAPSSPRSLPRRSGCGSPGCSRCAPGTAR